MTDAKGPYSYSLYTGFRSGAINEPPSNEGWQGFFEINGPNDSKFHLHGTEDNAKAMRDRLNAAYAAGRASRDGLREALDTVLPMAKGYASQNRVGRNIEKVENAEKALAEDEKGE